MAIVAETDGVRCLRAMVPMRDGVRLNTFVFLPPVIDPQTADPQTADPQGPDSWPVILQRTPYCITTPQGQDITNPLKGWLPDPAAPMRGSLLRGWKAIVAKGYVAVYQDCRGRYGSEGEDHVYADDAADGFDTLEWIAAQPWSNGRVGLSGSSAGATTALAAASQNHSSVKAFFTQVGGSSIYDDVVCEGQSIELERLWLWVANNIPGLSESHRQAVLARSGLDEEQLAAVAASARVRYLALDAARHDRPPYVSCEEWMHLPLLGYPDFSIWQPYLDELLSHPIPDDFRARHDFRSTIDIPGFHVTTWFDIFLTSVLAAFSEIHARVGNQKLWIGPNDHYFVYEPQFWARDPYFEWFDHWLKGEETAIIDEPAIFYSPRCWVDDPAEYVADDWRHADAWPPGPVRMQRVYLRGDGALGDDPHGPAISYRYDPRAPVPTLGGRNMLITSGSRDQRPVQETPEYGPVYLGEVLPAAVTIAGPVSVTLHVESDCPDTDFVAKLIERHADGRAMLLMDGVTRAMLRPDTDGRVRVRPLVVGEVVEVELRLGHIHHRFSPGSRIEIDVTSSNFPRRARNTNSGNLLLAADTDDHIRVATNTVHHDPSTPSYVTLPIMTPSILRG